MNTGMIKREIGGHVSCWSWFDGKKRLKFYCYRGVLIKRLGVPVETALSEGEGRRRHHVMLDFSKVSSLDSAGIGKLLLLYYSLRKKGADLTVMNPRPSVEKILHLVNFVTLFPIVQQKAEVRSVA